MAPTSSFNRLEDPLRPRAGLQPRDLAEYQRHLDLYGPECVLEAAASDGLSTTDLGALKALIDSRHRVSRYSGGHWQETHVRSARACEECGLDLPRGSNERMRRHPHCKSRVRRRRAANA